MRNYEILKKIYDRCPDFRLREYTFDQLFDRCLDIRDMIERERPEIAKAHPDYNRKTSLEAYLEEKNKLSNEINE
jgi:hypothetical protein